MPAVLIAFHKPYSVLSQFTPEAPGQRTLAEFAFPKNVYPIGRLDADSEGLLLLSDERELNERLLHPRHAHDREYWAQVERIPTPEALKRLAGGMVIQGRTTLPCRAWILEPQPEIPLAPAATSRHTAAYSTPEGMAALRRTAPTPMLPPRDPPIRFRKTVATCWIGLELVEGKNRQVRRMTAAVGHPTLRLIRVRIGWLQLRDLPPCQWRVLTPEESQAIRH